MGGVRWLRASLLLCLLATATAPPSPTTGDHQPLQDLEYEEDQSDAAEGGDGWENEGDVLSAWNSLQLTQFDFADACTALADARWRWLLEGSPADGDAQMDLWTKEAALGGVARLNAPFVQQLEPLGESVAVHPGYHHGSEEASGNTEAANEAKAAALLADQLPYALRPGDLLLPQTLLEQKLNYSHAVQGALSRVRVPCGGAEPQDCVMTLPVVLRVLARSGDPAQQLRAWRGAVDALVPLAEGFPAQLRLARAAAVANANAVHSSADEDAPAPAEGEPPRDKLVADYWVLLQDLDEYLSVSFERVREMWTQVKPWHRRLAAFVHQRLRAAYGDAALAVTPTHSAENQTLLPAHLLGTLVGEDWSAVADLVFPGDGLRHLDAGLEKKGLKGRRLWDVALNELQELGVGPLPREALMSHVRLDGECPPPPQAADDCAGGASRVLACARGGWQQLAEAHAAAAHAAHALLGTEADKTALLRTATRHSAFHDAMPALFRLLSLEPEWLEQLGVLEEGEEVEEEASEEEEKREDEEEEEEEDEEEEEEEETGGGPWVSLRFLTALRVLPRLAFLAAVDDFRLRLLGADPVNSTAAATPPDAIALWQQIRREYMLVGSPAVEGGAPGRDATWLAVPEAAANEPLLGPFVAELLAFQALEQLAAYDRDRPLAAIKDNPDVSFGDLFSLGHSQRWPTIINDHFDINEIRVEPLLRYLKPLGKVLDAAEKKSRSGAETGAGTGVGVGPEGRAKARAAVDLSPPAPRASVPAAPPSSAAAFPAQPPTYESPDGSPDPSASAPPSADAALPPADAPADAVPSPSATSPALVRAGTASATTRSAVLGASLAVFALALVAGAAVGGRKLMRRRAYLRNRRPGARPTAVPSANGDVPSAPDVEAAEESDPATTPEEGDAGEDDGEAATAATPVCVAASA